MIGDPVGRRGDQPALSQEQRYGRGDRDSSPFSDRNQYFRFFTVPPYLQTFARKVVRRAAANYTVGAFEGDELIGVANFVRCDDPAVAEVAIVVAHEDRLRATAQLRHLGHAARRRGIRHFAAGGLAKDGLMLGVLRDSD